jgi:GNAT superfamily N-acetyltransferase
LESDSTLPLVKIRTADLADAEGIARVHVDSWRSTYQGILPANFLSLLSYERRTAQWKEAIGQVAETNWVFVAESRGSQIVGFLSCGPIREELANYAAEIFAIYLLKEWQGIGIGRRIFERAFKELKTEGYKSVMLWVLKSNPARKFYERMGGELIGEKQIEIGGVRLIEIAYGWSAL